MCLVFWVIVDGILVRLMEDLILWFKLDGFKWSDVYDYIDWDVLRKFWVFGNILVV